VTLQLDHQQRLNLHGLLGSQRASVNDMRALWKLQDRLDLSDEERAAIGYRVEQINEQEVPVWDRQRSLAPREFDLTDAEAARIRKAIDEWPHFLTRTDRLWLEPILAQLPEASTNGHKE
jgi:hypothetical protein